MHTISVLSRLELLVAIALLLFSTPATAQRRRPSPTGATGLGTPSAQPPQVFSVKGWVAEAGSQRRIEYVRVELHAFTGPIVGQIFTGSNGDFEFDNVATGTYNLIVAPIEYETVSQQVQVLYAPVWGLEVEVHRPAEALGVKEAYQGSKVSVRELSIPQKAQGAMEKGLVLLYKNSDYSGSIKQFERAVQAYPDYYEAYAQIGVAYKELGDLDSSEQALRKSVELSEEHYLDAMCLLAALLSDAGRFAEAEPIARKALEIDSQSWQANSALSKALLGLNRYTEAEANASTAVKLQPNNPMLHLVLANIHIKLQNYSAVVDDLNAYLRLDPTGPFAKQARTERDAIQRASTPAQASGPIMSAGTQKAST